MGGEGAGSGGGTSWDQGLTEMQRDSMRTVREPSHIRIQAARHSANNVVRWRRSSNRAETAAPRREGERTRTGWEHGHGADDQARAGVELEIQSAAGTQKSDGSREEKAKQRRSNEGGNEGAAWERCGGEYGAACSGFDGVRKTVMLITSVTACVLSPNGNAPGGARGSATQAGALELAPSSPSLLGGGIRWGRLTGKATEHF
ncbi:hypothetical protein DFH09DRAFT_1093664 [Mycena vulgaris]|nr:hypothetical protein DFH09DRAFT_1093664 [Mycena vulgaris]